MINCRAATRSTTVTFLDTQNWKCGDIRFPPNEHFENGEPPEELWVLYMRTKTGLLDEGLQIRLFQTEADLRAAQEKYRVGMLLPESSAREMLESADIGTEQLRRFVDSRFVPSAGSAGSEESPLAFEVLAKAGITKLFGPPTKEVMDWLGKERVDELKRLHVDNWASAACFEYCLANLPASSPAFLAALHMFHYYITGNDFAAGYYWRDMEVAVHGIEAEAAKVQRMRVNAGRQGSKASAKARNERRTSLLGAMETIASRNPDIGILGERAVVLLAVEECKRAKPSLWGQGSGQALEYLGEIRRGEAGDAMQARYDKLFPRKVPKRS